MSLLFIAPNRDMSDWKRALLDEDPDLDIEIWPNVKDKKRVQFAVCWNQPRHLLDSYPNLKAVSSLGAGVDHLFRDESLPQFVDICRVVSPALIQQMKEYILGAVLAIQRNFVTYIRQKDQGKWQLHNHFLVSEFPIGVMGLGKLGLPVAQTLANFGYPVSGWSRSSKQLDNVKTYAGTNELHPFLNNSKILICLLPLTEDTEGILNLDLFKHLKDGAWIINAARGEHLVDEDLIYALDSDILNGAWLDVFSQEPLSERHPFWSRSNIMITPHVASITKPSEVAGQIVENYKRAISGIPLKNTVDRRKGY
jgi:glyoxylate/hydroxypyruvate reductase A